MHGTTSGNRRRRRLWRFGPAAFDEGSWALTVDGAPVPLEAKPLELLHELLLRAGEVATKDELLDAVWPGVEVVEASLTTAVLKLRRALGDARGKRGGEGGGERIIETVPRIGYRLAIPVTVESIAAPLGPRFAFVPGDAVPGRPQWRLVTPLGESGLADVWRARHDKTGASRVFKFADAPDRLRSLKREAAIARLLMASLGEDGPFVPLLEWNFDAAPYTIESVDGGESLIGWAAAKGGLSAVPLARRLAVATAIARALAAVHGVGVLHKDLKPANILIAEDGDGAFRIRLADFGSGQVIDGDVLAAHAITDLGTEAGGGASTSSGGTARYRAPELVGDALPTVRSDIYALGLILFQLAVGDFDRSLAPGWEGAVSDPLLCADIAEAAAGDPRARLASADLLADRLERLDTRRTEAEAEAARAAQLAALRRDKERRAIRRPWVRAAAAVLVLGLIATSTAAIIAQRQRGKALRQQGIAEASYGFLANDLLARADPAKSEGVQETLGDAARRAAGEINRRFAQEPLVAARLHATLAKALQERGDVTGARAEFQAAEERYAAAGAAGSEDAAIVRLTHAQAEVASWQAEGAKRALTIVADERRRFGPRAEQGRLGLALAKAEGLANYFGDLKASEAAYARAIRIMGADPGLAPPRDMIRIRTAHALLLMRGGRAAEAEKEMREVVAQASALYGPDQADTLNARQNLLNALALQHHDREMVAGADALLPLFEKRYGPDHRLTLALLSGRGDSLMELGRYDDAAADARRVWQAAGRVAGPKSYQALVGHVDFAIDRCRGARAAEGLAEIRQASADVEAAFGRDYPLAHAVRYHTAECLLALGRTGEAKALLPTIDRAKVAELVGDPGWGGNIDLAEAEIALTEGDKAGARALVAKAEPAFRDDNPLGFEKRRIARLKGLLAAA